MKKLSLISLATTLALLAGCAGNECYENHSALPLAAFYSSSTMQAVTVQKLEIFGLGAPGDSILYTPQNLNQAYLPFRLGQDSTQFVLVYAAFLPDDIPEGDITDYAPSDTITFRYKPKEWFVSPACGAMYFFDMKETTHSSFLIDSISCNEVITNENAVNIKIFFKDNP